MYTLFTTNNKIKSNIKGFWKNKSKIFIDNIHLKNYSNLLTLNFAIRKLFKLGEIAIFYKTKHFAIVQNKKIKTVLNKKITFIRKKLSIIEIKNLIKKYNGIAIYKKQSFYLIEVFYQFDYTLHDKIFNSDFYDYKIGDKKNV